MQACDRVKITLCVLLFLNSLAASIKQANLGITVEVIISILLYADDIVLLSETEEQLKNVQYSKLLLVCKIENESKS